MLIVPYRRAHCREFHIRAQTFAVNSLKEARLQMRIENDPFDSQTVRFCCDLQVMQVGRNRVKVDFKFRRLTRTVKIDPIAKLVENCCGKDCRSPIGVPLDRDHEVNGETVLWVLWGQNEPPRGQPVSPNT